MTENNAPRIRQIDSDLAKARARVAQVQRRDKELLRRQLIVEKGPRRKGEEKDALEKHLDAILEGNEANPLAEKPDTLSAILAERELLAKAIQRGIRLVEELVLQRATLIFADNMPRIVALEKQRILLAVELQAVNAAREELRENLRSQGAGGMSFPTDGFDMLGLPTNNDEVAGARERALADRVVTKADVTKAAGNGR